MMNEENVKDLQPEAVVQTEGISSDNAAKSECEVSGSTKVNKLYNILTLAHTGFLLFAQLFLFIAMCVGIVAVNGVNFSVNGLLSFYRVIGYKRFLAALPTLIPLGVFSILWIILLITVIIALIKTIISFFKFIRLNEEYQVRSAKFAAYVNRVAKSYGNAVMLIIASLIVTPAFTAMGTGVVALACIIYACNTAFCVCDKLIQRDGEKFNWFLFGINLGGKLTMFLIACLAAAGINESLTVALENLVNLNFVMFDNGMLFFCSLYFNALRPVLLVVPFAIAATIAAKALKYYPFANCKADINSVLKKLFITLLVFALIFAVADGVLYGKLYGVGTGVTLNYVVKNWFGFLFLSIAGIVLTQTFITKKETVVAA